MKRTIHNLKRAIKAGIEAAKDPILPARYKAGSKLVICSQCQNDRFEAFAGALLAAHVFECSDCGHLELFARPPKEVPEK